jgi:filamentous hemagglutinin family protein
MRRVEILTVFAGLSMTGAVGSAELPIPCGGGVCAGGPAVWTSDAASLSVFGNSMRIDQTDPRVILNWSSFNVSEDGHVQFVQPDASAIALNRIFEGRPSSILGSIEANGQIYLINPSGILFGENSSVDTNSLVASTLDVQDGIFRGAGIVRAIDQGTGLPAFTGTGAMGGIEIESGARITTPSGGRVLILAPEVVNAGSIETPDGQTILGASFDRVYLQASDDPALRGLLIEVGTGGDVSNVGNILAERGNVTLVGLAVNNSGSLSATTTVKANGSVRLLARDRATVVREGSQNVLTSVRGGDLSIDGTVSVLPELDDDAVAVDDQPQQDSRIELMGRTVQIGSAAQIRASGGVIDVTATARPNAPLGGAIDADSWIDIAGGALLDVAGVSGVELPMSRNLVEFELRANELADAPLQRDGELRGERVVVDARTGTPLANTAAVVAGIQRTVGERLTAGGTVSLATNGAVRVHDEAKIDISGGDVRYQDGNLATTGVISEGAIIDISQADPNKVYSGTFGSYTKEHTRWGVSETFGIAGLAGGDSLVRGYTEGKDAGALGIRANDLLLDGNVIADVVSGVRQRARPEELTTSRFARPFDQMPADGRLTVDLTVSPSANVDVALGEGTTDGAVQLGSSLFAGGAGSFSLVTNGSVEARDLNLTLPDYGAFRLQGGSITLSGQLDIPSGTIELTSSRVDGTNAALRIEDAVLDVSGRWQNDVLGDASGGALALDGGTIALDARGDLYVSAASTIRADAGAWLSADGSIRFGRGGDVSLAADLFDQSSAFDLRGAISGFGFSEAGSLSLSANAITLVSGIPIPGGGGSGTPDYTHLVVNSSALGGLGFQHIELIANRSDLVVMPGSTIAPQIANLMLLGDSQQMSSARSIRSVAGLTTLPEYLRQPMDLRLAALQTTRSLFAPTRLEIGAGAQLLLDPKAELTLETDGQLLVNGLLSALGGEVTLQLSKPGSETDPGFLASQFIQLGAESKIDVVGLIQPTPNDVGLRTGDVIDAGSVSIIAARGYVLARSGATVDASGATGILDLTVTDNVHPEPVQVESKAGTISIAAAEGMLLDADLRAHAAPLAGAIGGTLSVSFDPSRRGQLESDVSFPETDRVLRLGSTATPVQIPLAGPVPSALNGYAALDEQIVLDGGFESLELLSRNVPDRQGNPLVAPAFGVVEIANEATVALADTLVVDAPVIRVAGQDSRFESTYALLGSTQPGQVTIDAPAAGSGRLSVASKLIDLVGTTTVSGAAETNLTAGQGLRLRGLQQTSSSGELLGMLHTTGDVNIAAGMVFPSTLSDYTFNLDGTGNFSQAAAPAAAVDPLSAGGSLHVNAQNIAIDGSMKAPLGNIDFNARGSLVLGDGANVSTAAATDIPFGQTQGLLDWIVPLNDVKAIVVERPPEKSITLSGASVQVAPLTTLDLRGGGDLSAYEFVPGPGGTRDVLDVDFEPGSFAVMPSLDGSFAPFDPVESAGFDAAVTDGVYLAGVPGLPDGVYAKLPPRYALQPGAFLVRPIDAAMDPVPGSVVIQSDGVAVIAGRDVVLGTDAAAVRWTSFRVEPTSVVRQRAEYELSKGNDFFEALAEANDSAVPRLARDGGELVVAAKDELDFAGSVTAGGAADGQGGRLSVVGDAIRIIGADGIQGGVTLRADQLNSVQAASILIGGLRTSSGTDEFIDVTAHTIDVADGVQLATDELILMARDGVTVGAGATITANETETDDDAATLRTAGDVAVVAVSGTRTLQLDKTADVGAVGRIVFGDASRIEAGRSLIVRGGDAVELGGHLVAQGGAATLGASQIRLGGSNAAGAGISISQTTFDELGATAITLQSGSNIEVAGDFAMAAETVTLQTNAIDNVAGAITADISADRIRIVGVAGNSAVAATGAQGSLALRSDRLDIADVALGIDGFDNVLLEGRTAIVGSDAVLNSSSARTLTLASSLVTTANGRALGVVAPESAIELVSAEPDGATLSLPGLAGAIEINGAVVTNGTRVETTGGLIALAGRDGVTLAGGRVSVAGAVLTVGKQNFAVQGGSVALTSSLGNVVVGSDSTIDVTGPTNAGGSLAIAAADGSVALDGTLVATTGASLDVDANTLPSLGLPAAAAASGFDGRLVLRQRSGDLTIDEALTIAADEVRIGVDSGSLTVSGSVSTGSSGRSEFRAGGDVIVTGTAVLASSGADLRLGSSSGIITVADGAQIALGDATRQGVLEVRVSQQAPGNPVIIGPAASINAAQLAVELFTPVTVSDGVLDAADLDVLRIQFDGLQSGLAALDTGLGGLGVPVVTRPGIEVRAPNDLLSSSLWDLSDWRVDGDPGMLVIRAGGDLTVDGGISDGVTEVALFDEITVLTLAATDSWDLGISVGADLGASDPMAVVAGRGNFTLDSGAAIRTGTGAIDIAAGGDLRFADATAAIYTAGRSTGAGTLPPLANIVLMQLAEYPEDGGDVNIAVGGDIVGAPSHQLFTEWWWRIGGPSELLGDLPTNYGVALKHFQQGVASFGGGNISIAAGGDIRDLSAVLPITAQHVGDLTQDGSDFVFTDNSFIRRGGGNLDVTAGGDIYGGTFWVADGVGKLQSGGEVRASGVTGLGLIVGLSDASAEVIAANDVIVEGVMNPSLLPQSDQQSTVDALRSYFTTYGPGSAFEATSLAGDVNLNNDIARIGAWVDLDFGAIGQDDRALDLYPGIVTARAVNGGIQLSGSFSIYPDQLGGLSLFAHQDVTATRVSINISDADLDLLPDEQKPANSLNELVQRIPRGTISSAEFFHAKTPVHVGDPTPSQIVSDTGDIAAADLLQVVSAEPLQVLAGRDARNLDLRIQNVAATDISLLEAGRDIKYTTQRSESSGLVLDNRNRIEIAGPGRMDVMAARNIDLGTSEGVISTGDLGNSALADDGADVQVFAGVAGIDDAKFIAEFVLPSAANRKIVADAIRIQTGDDTLTEEAALALFADMSEFERRGIVQDVLFAELEDVGEANATEGTGFERGFDAIAALYPDAADRAGDLSLFFSRIQTTDGGDINLNVPFGLMNAGLSASFAGAKQPNELGVVVQRTGDLNAVVNDDILVNQSRIFALDGGSILLWSSEGDIDAGRGAKTALAAPAPVVTFDQNGNVVIEFPAAIAGSGIRSAVSTPGLEPGDVFLFAPAGIVNAGDAGIVSAGNLTIAATEVIGADNIDVGGIALGVPVDTSGLAAGLGGIGDVSAAASQSAEEAAAGTASEQADSESLAGSAMGWLDVLLEGYGPADGETQCDKATDHDCKG